MGKFKFVLSCLLVLLFSFFALASTEDESDANQGEGSVAAVEGGSSSDDTSIGKYSVEIDSCRMAKDYEGKDVVIVKYIFTNVSDEEPTAFYTAFDDEVYQNGISLNGSYVLDDSADYSSDNQTKKIKKGASVDVEVAYELNDSTTDIEVEVKELFSFNDKTLKKTFKLK